MSYCPVTKGEKFLFDLRISAVFKGHAYLKSAIDLSLEDVSCLEKGQVFRKVADIYHIEPSCVQTAIKTALGHAKNGSLLYEIIGLDYSLNIHPMKFLASVYWYFNGVRPLLDVKINNRMPPLGYTALIQRNKNNWTFDQIAASNATSSRNVSTAYKSALHIAHCLLSDKKSKPNQYLMYMYCVDEEQIEAIAKIEKQIEAQIQEESQKETERVS